MNISHGIVEGMPNLLIWKIGLFVKYFLLTAMLTGVSNNAVFWQKMEYELKQWLEKMTAIAASSDHGHPSSGWRHITRATANADKDTNLTLFFIESIF